MARLIDADALNEAFDNEGADLCMDYSESCEWGFSYESVHDLIGNAPTIDAEPVRHGHWIYNKDTGEIRCNLCNALVGVTMYSDDVEPIAEVENFCFNCGAKMDEVSE